MQNILGEKYTFLKTRLFFVAIQMGPVNLAQSGMDGLSRLFQFLVTRLKSQLSLCRRPMRLKQIRHSNTETGFQLTAYQNQNTRHHQRRPYSTCYKTIYTKNILSFVSCLISCLITSLNHTVSWLVSPNNLQTTRSISNNFIYFSVSGSFGY